MFLTVVVILTAPLWETTPTAALGVVAACGRWHQQARAATRRPAHAHAHARALTPQTELHLRRPCRPWLSLLTMWRAAPSRSSLIFTFSAAKPRCAHLSTASPLPQQPKCFLVSNLHRARFWLHAGDHVEPEEEIRNREYFHARVSDLPKKGRYKSRRGLGWIRDSTSFFCESFTPSTGELGVVNHSVPLDELDAAAVALAGEISARSAN